jgi:hypothetical protein
MPFDAWSGLTAAGMTTPAARRMLALAGMSFSFDTASDRLAELCLLKVSNDTIRRVSEAEGEAARQFLASSPPRPRRLRHSPEQKATWNFTPTG